MALCLTNRWFKIGSKMRMNDAVKQAHTRIPSSGDNSRRGVDVAREYLWCSSENRDSERLRAISLTERPICASVATVLVL